MIRKKFIGTTVIYSKSHLGGCSSFCDNLLVILKNINEITIGILCSFIQVKLFFLLLSCVRRVVLQCLAALRMKLSFRPNAGSLVFKTGSC